MENNEVNYQRDVKYGGEGKKSDIFVVEILWEYELLKCPIEIFYFSNVPNDDAVGIALN